jgi:hypothetical protein
MVYEKKPRTTVDLKQNIMEEVYVGPRTAKHDGMAMSGSNSCSQKLIPSKKKKKNLILFCILLFFVMMVTV